MRPGKSGSDPSGTASWGRFYFEGNPASLQQIVSVLPSVDSVEAPKATSGAAPTASWTHRELVAHLQSKGLKVSTKRAAETNPDRTFSGPGLMLVLPGGEVYAQLRKSANEAREKSGADPTNTASWGRFYFEGNPASLNQIIGALPQ